MYQPPKIKITDNTALRKDIFELIQNTSHNDLSNWAIECAQHIFQMSDEPLDKEAIQS